MNLVKEYLGKVSITCNGKHDINKAYDRLCIVYTGDSDNIRSYISKKSVPKAVSLSNADYWQPIAVNANSSGGGSEEQNPYAITDLYVRHYNDETVEIPEAGTYIIGTRQSPGDTLIRLESLNWGVILAEAIPNINEICTKDSFDSLDIEIDQRYENRLELTLVYYDDGEKIDINGISIPIATQSYAGLMSASDKQKVDSLYNPLAYYDETYWGFQYVRKGQGVYLQPELNPSTGDPNGKWTISLSCNSDSFGFDDYGRLILRAAVASAGNTNIGGITGDYKKKLDDMLAWYQQQIS